MMQISLNLLAWDLNVIVLRSKKKLLTNENLVTNWGINENTLKNQYASNEVLL